MYSSFCKKRWRITCFSQICSCWRTPLRSDSLKKRTEIVHSLSSKHKWFMFLSSGGSPSSEPLDDPSSSMLDSEHSPETRDSYLLIFIVWIKCKKHGLLVLFQVDTKATCVSTLDSHFKWEKLNQKLWRGNTQNPRRTTYLVHCWGHLKAVSFVAKATHFGQQSCQHPSCIQNMPWEVPCIDQQFSSKVQTYP